MIAKTWNWGMEGDSLAWRLPSTGKGVDAWKPECSRTLTVDPRRWSDTWTLVSFPQLCRYFLSSRLHYSSLFPLSSFLKINEDVSTPQRDCLSALQAAACLFYFIVIQTPSSVVLKVGSVDARWSPSSDYFHSKTKMSSGIFDWVNTLVARKQCYCSFKRNKIQVFEKDLSFNF